MVVAFLVSPFFAIFIVFLTLLVFSCKQKNRFDKLKPDERRFYQRAPQSTFLISTVISFDSWLNYWFNKRIKPLNKKKIMKIVKKSIHETKDLLGEQIEFKKGAKLFLKEASENSLAFVGTSTMETMFTKIAETRVLLINYIRKNKDILNEKIDKPLLITGLPRSGSTLLYNLLALDPKSRAPKFWEMIHWSNPTPPATKQQSLTNNHERYTRAVARLAEIQKLVPSMIEEMNKSHYAMPNEIEEELLTLFQSYILQIHMPFANQQFEDWFCDQYNKTDAYKYLYIFLQMLQSGWKPESHWVLKTPLHGLYIQNLLEQFNDANVIITHRTPLAVVASFSKYLASQCAFSFIDGTLDKRKIGRGQLRVCSEIANRIMQYRDSLPAQKQQNFIDVDYDQLVKNPIETVRSIYKQSNKQFTPEFEQLIKDYLLQNPQGKHGRAEYTNEEFGLSETQIKNTFDKYIQRHLSHLSKKN
eukprot:TRINITY_DN1267_c3_g1_i1.p1 TRINITY_DN1267_c3_g1~~TRINITY_DN1267_c3_g1_i1.p1  ORF type:complete len:473 (-),score=192.31 TRINITY_DN1267_c3_g1_i1:240-1658(-)